MPPLLGLAYAATQTSVDVFGVTLSVRWDRALWAAARSLGLASLVLGGAVAVGGFLGWGQARWSGRAVQWTAALAALPLVVPSYVMAAALSQAWAGVAGAPATGVPAAAAVLVLATAPLVQLTVATGLSATSAAEEEAARSLGASDAAVFRAVLWPRLRPALALSGLLAALYAISDFGVVAILDVPVLTWKMYDAVARQQLARAAVLGGLAFAAVAPLALLAWRVRGGGSAEGVANVRPLEPRPAGPVWTGLFVAVGGAVSTLGAGIPVAVLAGWVWEGLDRGLSFAAVAEPLSHTLVIAVGGAAFVTLTAAIPALARGGRALEGAVYATSVLPAILVAFGWLGASLAVARTLGGKPVYAALLGSGVVLALAYAARFLAELHGPIKTAALRLDPRHRESVAVLGASERAWFRHVALPGILPGVRTALLLGVLLLAKELPITLILGTPAGLKPLAFRMWDRHSEALFHDAGLAGLLLVAVAVSGRLAWALSERSTRRPGGARS